MYSHVCRSANSVTCSIRNYRSSAVEWLLICTDRCFFDRSMGNCFPFPWERYSQAYGQHRTKRSTGAINITEWSIEISARLLYIMRLTVTCVVVLCGKPRTGVPGCASNQFPCVFIRIFSLRERLSLHGCAFNMDQSWRADILARSNDIEQFIFAWIVRCMRRSQASRDSLFSVLLATFFPFNIRLIHSATPLSLFVSLIFQKHRDDNDLS